MRAWRQGKAKCPGNAPERDVRMGGGQVLQLQYSPHQRGKVAAGYFGSGGAAQGLHRGGSAGGMRSPLRPGWVLGCLIHPQGSPIDPKSSDHCKLGAHSAPPELLGHAKSTQRPHQEGETGRQPHGKVQFCTILCYASPGSVPQGSPWAGEAERDTGELRPCRVLPVLPIGCS